MQKVVKLIEIPFVLGLTLVDPRNRVLSLVGGQDQTNLRRRDNSTAFCQITLIVI